MVLITEIEVFEKTARDMLRAPPRKTRLTTKFYRSDPSIFPIRITDGRQLFQMEFTKEQGVKAAQTVISTLMHMMTSTELLS
jgi:hypothetical protein